MATLNQSDFERIEKYIQGQANYEEATWVETLFLDGEKNFSLRHLLEKDWINMVRDSSVSDIDLRYLLDQVHHKIRKKEGLERKTLYHRFIRVYLKVAAIFFMPLMIAGGLIYSFKGNHFMSIDQQASFVIYSPMGSRVSFNLPDGTVGKLNSGSKLSYSLPFNKNRHIELEGEGWFEVNHDQKHPFEITAGSSTVTVLGTKLNVCAYPAENYIEVVLAEGKVKYINEMGGEVFLSPSEMIVYKDGKINRSTIDPEKYNAWTSGKLIFKGDQMLEVARRIERWYNIKVVLHDKELEQYSFRGTFEDDKLDEVLRFLSMTSPISYKITHGGLLADGTWEKEKVTIYLKK